MQEEQEPSVSDILSSIRQILSDKLDEEASDRMQASQEPAFDFIEEESIVHTPEIKPIVNEQEDVLVLTPQMQLPDEQEREEISAPIISEERSMNQSSSFVSNQVEQNIQPLIQDWLDRHLPQMVERIVSEEVRRIFNKR